MENGEEKEVNEIEEKEKVEALVKILSAEDIENAEDINRELVHVPEWGGSVWVYGLNGLERDAFEETMIVGKGKNQKRNLANIRARLCARCIRDENGKRMFKKERVEKLGQKSAKALDRVFSVAQRLCGMSKEDVDDLVGN